MLSLQYLRYNNIMFKGNGDGQVGTYTHKHVLC